MSAVVDFVEDVAGAVGDLVEDVGGAITDVVDWVGEEVIDPVMTTVGNTIDAALEDPIGTIATVATAIVAPELLPLVNGAKTLANGGDLDDALKSAAVSYVAVEASAAGGDYLGDAATAAGADATTAKVIDQVATGAIRSATGAALTGGDPLQALINGGVSAGTSSVLAQIPGFDQMSPEAQRAASAAVAAELTGRDPTQALVNAALNAGIAAARAPDQTSADLQTVLSEQDQQGDIDQLLSDIGQYEVPQEIPSEPTPAEPTPAEPMPETPTQDELVNIVNPPAEPAPETVVSEEGKDTSWQGPMGPMDAATTQKYSDEFAKYLDWLQAGSPEADQSQYPIQDPGITEENWDSFNQNLLQMQEEGRLPTQWRPNEDGTFTYQDDDGSTLTINQSGEVTGFTEAPVGNLPGETPATSTPSTTTAPTTAPTTPTTPSVPTTPALNLLQVAELTCCR